MMTANDLADQTRSENTQQGMTHTAIYADVQNCETALRKIILLAEEVLASDDPDIRKSELLPVLLGVHAHAFQVLSCHQSENGIKDESSSNQSRQQVYLSQVEDATRIAAIRAIAMREDALEYYRAGWRVETWTPKKGSGSTYAQFRRCVNGKREAKYLGVVSSCKDNRNKV